jgi:hypothetical protein
VIAGAAILISVTSTPTPISYFIDTIRIVILISTTFALITLLWQDPVLTIASQVVPAVTRTFTGSWCSGGFGNPNFYAGAVAFTFPFFIFHRLWRWALIPIGIVFLFSGTLGAFIALAGAGVVLIRWKWSLPWWVVGSVGVAGLMVGFVLDGEGITGLVGNERLEWWTTAWEGITSSPWVLIFGHGPCTYTPYTPPLHNDYLTLWYQFGLVGLGLAVWALSVLWRMSPHIHHRASLVAFCLFSLPSRPMQMPMVGVLFIIVIGLIYRERDMV